MFALADIETYPQCTKAIDLESAVFRNETKSVDACPVATDYDQCEAELKLRREAVTPNCT